MLLHSTGVTSCNIRGMSAGGYLMESSTSSLGFMDVSPPPPFWTLPSGRFKCTDWPNAPYTMMLNSPGGVRERWRRWLPGDRQTVRRLDQSGPPPPPPSVNAAAYNSRDYVTVHCSTPLFSLHRRHTCILFRCSVTVCLYASLCFIASLLCCLFYLINSNLFVDK